MRVVPSEPISVHAAAAGPARPETAPYSCSTIPRMSRSCCTVKRSCACVVRFSPRLASNLATFASSCVCIRRSTPAHRASHAVTPTAAVPIDADRHPPMTRAHLPKPLLLGSDVSLHRLEFSVILALGAGNLGPVCVHHWGRPAGVPSRL